MYIQITTRCNMTCEHCGFACTAQGEDMTLETLMNALAEDNEMITIGGGEPTLHPLFWQFLGMSIAQSDYVWMATNGSITETSLALAKMAKKGVISCALSRDMYHDPIDYEVIEAFQKERTETGSRIWSDNDNDFREIRTVTGRESNAGRCDFGDDTCVCSDLIVKPNGDVYGCGCEDAPCFGNINTEYRLPDSWDYGMCCHEQTSEEVHEEIAA